MAIEKIDTLSAEAMTRPALPSPDFRLPVPEVDDDAPVKRFQLSAFKNMLCFFIPFSRSALSAWFSRTPSPDVPLALLLCSRMFSLL
jgi:hypothetical protein